MSNWPKSGAPRRLGRYEVVAEIARGGMGTVYLARNAGEAGFQRLFAIKLMHEHLAEDRQFIDMLIDEARIAARIHHPNVVAIVDLGVEEGRHFVVLEYVDGAAFSALLTRSKEARPPELIVPVIIDALEGLSAAHSLKDDENNLLHLVHRDVSPQNILVGADGVGRITDFGIAKAEARITSTRPGMRKGKIHYMAPEQLIEDGDKIDARADIFATGAVLWGALTGRSLFRGQNDAATVHNVLSKKIPPPSAVGFHPPAEFDAVCLRALERDPDERYQSALEMADALRRACAAQGIVTSHAAIAKWVSETLGDELEARREAVRHVATRSTMMESLPELPTLGPESAASLSPTYPNADATLPATTRSATPAALARSTSQSIELELVAARHAGRRRAAIVGAALLVPIAAGAVWLATRSSTTTSGPDESASAPVASQAAPNEEPSESVAEPATALPSSAPSAEASATPEEHEAEKPSRHVRRVVGSRRHAVASKPKPKPTASAKPPPTATAPPTATTKPPANQNSGMQFENNPYLRK